jgi:hypothetical protein
MKQTLKRVRAQPRKATPPVSFRSEETGDRTILLVDESFATATFTRTNTRQPIFLRLGPGLRVVLESRRIAKRRFAQLRIEIAFESGDGEASPATLGPGHVNKFRRRFFLPAQGLAREWASSACAILVPEITTRGHHGKGG